MLVRQSSVSLVSTADIHAHCASNLCGGNVHVVNSKDGLYTNEKGTMWLSGGQQFEFALFRPLWPCWLVPVG